MARTYVNDKGQFILGTTLIKELQKEDVCPSRILKVYISEEYPEEPTEAMLKGSYFETQCIGSTADETGVYDLTRTTKGEKTAEHKRIDFAVEKVFPQVLEQYGIVLGQKQKKVSIEVNEFILLQTTYDIEGTIEIDGKDVPAIFDLKMTKDCENTWGDYAWGKPEMLDLFQAPFTAHLFKVMNKEENYRKFIFLVFDYSPENKFKLIEKKITQTELKTMEGKINYAVSKIQDWAANGWGYKPKYEVCKKCGFRNECPQKIAKDPIIVV